MEPTDPLFPAKCDVCGKEVMVEQEVIDGGLIMCSEECYMFIRTLDHIEENVDEEDSAELHEKAIEDYEATQLSLLRIQDAVDRHDGLVTIPEEVWDSIISMLQTNIALLMKYEKPDATEE